MANFISRYVQESFQELRRVSWPTKNQAINLCILVIVFVAVAALIVAGIDYLLNQGFTFLISTAR